MKLLYFAKIREVINKSEEILELPQNINTTGDLIKFLATKKLIFMMITPIIQLK